MSGKSLPVLTEEEAEAALAEVNKQILKHFLEIDNQGRFKHPPRTDDELHLFIKLAFGVDIPRKAVIQGHSAPFQFLADLFFERVKNAVAFANRSGGKALSLSTRVFTSTGWKNFGDIVVGDEVLSHGFMWTTVTAVHEVQHGKPCYEITFEYDSPVRGMPVEAFVVDAEHLWSITQPHPEVISTYGIQKLLEEGRTVMVDRFKVVGLSPVESVPVRCIQVADQAQLFRIGTTFVPTHNTYDVAILNFLDMLFKPNCEIAHGGATKCLSVNTRVLTANRGWTTMGDLKRGDLVFTPEGVPTKVLSVSGAIEGRECFEITFNYGDEQERIVCDWEHIWPAQKLNYKPRLWATKDLFDHHHANRDPRPFSIECASGLTPKNIKHRITDIKKVPSTPVCCILVEHESSLFLVGESLIPTHNTQAKACYKYFLTFLEFPWFKEFCKRYCEVTGREKFVVKENQDESEFANNATQTIIVSSEKGLRSPHPQKARLDEVDLIDWEILLTGLSMARSSQDRKIKGQNVFTSTRQNEHGSMQRLLDEADTKGIKVYEWNIWDVVEKCPRQCENDPEFGTCPILTYCGGRAHESEGFYPIEDFIDKARMLDRERFEIEWENKRPSRARMVLPMLDPTRHLMTPQRLYQLTGHFKPQPWWQVVSGMDFGGSPGHPFVYLKFCQLPNGAWLCFWEHMDDSLLLRERAKIIKASPFWKPSEAIYSDWTAQDRKELTSLGVRLILANKDFDMSLDYIRSLFRGLPPKEDPLLYWWNGDIEGFPPCKQSWQELLKYNYPVGQDGKPVSEKPIKVNDNACDALRYGLYTWKVRGGGTQYRTRRVEGI